MSRENRSAPKTGRKNEAADEQERNPRPSSSVGYYDFTPDYPGEQRADGLYFRNDAPKRFTRRQKLLIAAAAAAVFCAAFTVCRVMVHISEKQPGHIGDAPAWATESTVPPPELVTEMPGDG